MEESHATEGLYLIKLTIMYEVSVGSKEREKKRERGSIWLIFILKINYYLNYKTQAKCGLSYKYFI
jgi:hypothetical protein